MKTAAYVAGAALTISLMASAAELGDPKSGYGIAQRVCSECHAVERGKVSPHPQAPAFATIANAPGRTAVSLLVWVQSPHRSMPDFMLGEREGDDLIAYILSLKKSR